MEQRQVRWETPQGETIMEFKALALHPSDNVAVLLSPVGPGERVRVRGREGLEIEACQAIAFGHKIALADIERGELIRKYGRPIGAAEAAIKKGDHVHIHNVTGLRARKERP
jgi:altronate dehydratase